MTELAPLLPGQVGEAALGAPKLPAVDATQSRPAGVFSAHDWIVILGTVLLFAWAVVGIVWRPI